MSRSERIFTRETTAGTALAGIKLPEPDHDRRTVGGEYPPADMAEDNAADWLAYASDGEITLHDDTQRVRVGSASLRIEATGGFDNLVRYPDGIRAKWDLTAVKKIKVSCYAENPNDPDFQNRSPWIRLGNADGYFEWYGETKGKKQPFFIRPKDGRMLAMAGLYEIWRDPAIEDDDFEDLVTTTHLVNRTMEDRGFAERLLCSVFPFRAAEGAPVDLVYAYKRGTFYPFAPKDGKRRDNALELQVEAAVGDDLPMERDRSRWFPVYGAPGL